MRASTLALAILAGLAAAPVFAQGCASPSVEGQLVEHKCYQNKYGAEVHSPAHSKNGQVPPGATAQCRDGSFSFSLSHRGTCSHHGGVAQWF